MAINKIEKGLLIRATAELNRIYSPKCEFELIESINGTWYIYPKFPVEVEDGQAEKKEEAQAAY